MRTTRMHAGLPVDRIVELVSSPVADDPLPAAESADEPPSVECESRPRRIVVAYNRDWSDEPVGADGAGCGDEAARSVERVASIVAAALRAHGVAVELLPVPDLTTEVVEALIAARPDAVFNLVESLAGDSSREGEFTALLERRGIPFTGNGSRAAATGFAKDLARAALLRAGVPVARGAVVDSPDEAVAAAEQVGFPAFVKPARADSSLGIEQGSVVDDVAALRARLEWLCAHLPGPFLVEEWLGGREFNISLLPIEPGVAITEIDYSGCPSGMRPLLSYASKWIEDSPEFYMCSVPLARTADPLLYDDLASIGQLAFAAIGGVGYGRVDLRLGDDGRPRVLEVNPNPDLDPAAGFSISARGLGIQHSDLIAAIAAEAIARAAHEHPSDPSHRPPVADPHP